MIAEGMTETAEFVDLSAHEPVLHVEDEGLEIKGYEIDGQFLLDFDWAPGSQWSFLDDEANFKQFVVNWLEEMTGQAMGAAEIEQLKIAREHGRPSSGNDSAGEEKEQPAD
jgi:hypothetical protein